MLRRRWVLVLVPTVLGVLIGLVSTLGATSSQDDEPRGFQATHTLILDLAHPDFVVPPNLAQTALRAEAGRVPRQAAVALGYEGSPRDLAQQVTTNADDELQSIEITAFDEDPGRAVEIADTFATELLAVLTTDANKSQDDLVSRLDEELAEQTTELAAAQAGLFLAPNDAALLAAVDGARAAVQATTVELAEASGQADAQIAIATLESAAAEPVADEGFAAPESREGRILGGGLIGLLIGIGTAILVDRYDTKISTRDDAVRCFDLPIAAEIPRLPRRNRHEIITVTRPGSPYAEAHRQLRSLVDLELIDRTAAEGVASLGQRAGVAVVTSPGPSEGKTTTAAHLAASFAELGRSTLLIDADFRLPRMHKVFGHEPSPGLTDVVLRRSDADTVPERRPPADALPAIARPTGIENLRLVSTGRLIDHPASLFAYTAELIEGARAHADVIIIDTPPLLLANDATDLLINADVVLMVGKIGKTQGRAAERAKELLDRVESPTVGVALVGVSASESGYGRYYRYRADTRDAGLFGWRRLLGRWRRDAADTESADPEPGEPEPTPEPKAPDEATSTDGEQTDVPAPTAAT